VRDITERKRAAETTAVLVHAAEQATEALIITDPRGSITYVNPAFERITGWKRDEVLGRNPRILRSDQHDGAFYRRMKEVLARGEVWKGRLVNRRKDGTLFEDEATISPVRDGAGRIVNYVAITRDTTNEARLARQLFQAQKMEAIGRLAAGVAHDFNNLLGVITGYGESLNLQLSTTDPLKDEVDQILKAAERAANLTRQLLAFGRKLVLRPEVLDLNGVVSGLEKMLLRLISEDVELVTRLEPGLANVEADPGRIEQIVMNLVLNARDAIPAGGKITIETRNTDLETSFASSIPSAPSGPFVMLAVTDTGSGMDAVTQSHVFEPFFSTKEVGKGTGLGLSTIDGIVNQSGGFVSVDSEVGVGTTFRVFLPRVEAAAEPTLEAKLGPLLGGSETVLLVEDEPAIRELLRKVLSANGYTVLSAAEADEAVRVAEAHDGPIDVLITDVVMPGLSGPKLADLLVRSRPATKVLFVSGYSDEAVRQHGLAGAGRAFLGKPFGLDLVLRTLRELLDSN
jgi:PAS domain S-box-containing protein